MSNCETPTKYSDGLNDVDAALTSVERVHDLTTASRRAWRATSPPASSELVDEREKEHGEGVRAAGSGSSRRGGGRGSDRRRGSEDCRAISYPGPNSKSSNEATLTR